MSEIITSSDAILSRFNELFCVCVVSTSRAENVPKISAKVHASVSGKIPIYFFVSRGEGKSYKLFGAENVIECERNICSARNDAFLFAKKQDKNCLQVSDDLGSIHIYDYEINSFRKTNFVEAGLELFINMISYGCMLAGVAITSNKLNFQPKKDNSKDCVNKLIVNDMIVLSKENEILYDVDAFLKEDYDMFVLQNIKYGSVARVDKIVCNFPHRENKGGANTYRIKETEVKQNEYVMRKHPMIIIPHTKREGQVSIDYKQLINKCNETN